VGGSELKRKRTRCHNAHRRWKRGGKATREKRPPTSDGRRKASSPPLRLLRINFATSAFSSSVSCPLQQLQPHTALATRSTPHRHWGTCTQRPVHPTCLEEAEQRFSYYMCGLLPLVLDPLLPLLPSRLPSSYQGQGTRGIKCTPYPRSLLVHN